MEFIFPRLHVVLFFLLLMFLLLPYYVVTCSITYPPLVVDLYFFYCDTVNTKSHHITHINHIVQQWCRALNMIIILLDDNMYTVYQLGTCPADSVADSYSMATKTGQVTFCDIK